ncbi:3b0b2aab-8dbd-4c2d-b40b-2036d3944062, partial [Sclerotinia trifoliorum]
MLTLSSGPSDRSNSTCFEKGLKYFPLYLSLVLHMSRSIYLSLSTDATTARVTLVLAKVPANTLGGFIGSSQPVFDPYVIKENDSERVLFKYLFNFPSTIKKQQKLQTNFDTSRPGMGTGFNPFK